MTPPPACYGFSPQLLGAAVARARRLGWHQVAREAGRWECRRLAALEQAAACEAAGGTGWAHYNAADSRESSAVLLDYAALVVQGDQLSSNFLTAPPCR